MVIIILETGFEKHTMPVQGIFIPGSVRKSIFHVSHLPTRFLKNIKRQDKLYHLYVVYVN